MPEVPSYHHDEMANLLGISERTLHRWNRTGRSPPFVYISERIKVYPADAYRAWLRSQQQNSLKKGVGRKAQTSLANLKGVQHKQRAAKERKEPPDAA
jgi:predicted DNA-binding transcriptional regulator AlpA